MNEWEGLPYATTWEPRMAADVIWVGIDVRRQFHAICGVDSSGHVVWERRGAINTNWAISRSLEQLRHSLRAASFALARRR